MIVNQLRRIMYEPRVRDVPVDDNALLGIHGAVLREKPLLRSAFETFYTDMAGYCDRFFKVPGIEVELGTGVGFFKQMRPQLKTSDVRKGPHIDLEIDAQAMDLPDASVRCIYAINVFHHLPEPELFFSELDRVLQPGGGCVLVEPNGEFFSALVHRHLHTDEHFDPNAEGWKTQYIGGPLSGANQALSYIVFQRDREEFNRKWGDKLEIVHHGYEINSLRYLLSGGLNFRSLAPSFMTPVIKGIEYALSPLRRFWSLHQVIVIRKRA